MKAAATFNTSAMTAEVNPWELSEPLVCEYAYDEGEPAILSGPPDNWHPGCPPCVEILSCKLAGVELIDFITASQRERIEEALVELHE